VALPKVAPRFPALTGPAIVALCAALFLGVAAFPQQHPRSKAGARASNPVVEPVGITPEMRIVTAHITPNALRADVSFLASDLLEGRDTPSRGLDIAAEYIASSFRRMGLDPVTGDSFYQAVPIQKTDAAEHRNDGPRDIAISGTANNVIGVLRGSDPALKDTDVIVSSHYDHLGLAPDGADRIFNGANDDASGTASVLEIANALASLHPRPKRSVLVILFCCEEKGLLGSKYYASHPLVPLEQTIAHINMEQMGRTDSTDGPHLNMMNVTGFDYSTIPALLVDSGKRVQISVVKDAQASDRYFRRSDNGPLADVGVPAHTVSVTYEFPDYHAVGDEWQKLDYDNMAHVDQAVGIAMLRLASAVTAPKWNDQDSTQRYIDAARKLQK
jgi:Zn-dependent M28 family amino/carboxypeptidase